jgi:hypothetical protein
LIFGIWIFGFWIRLVINFLLILVLFLIDDWLISIDPQTVLGRVLETNVDNCTIQIDLGPHFCGSLKDDDGFQIAKHLRSDNRRGSIRWRVPNTHIEDLAV